MFRNCIDEYDIECMNRIMPMSLSKPSSTADRYDTACFVFDYVLLKSVVSSKLSLDRGAEKYICFSADI